MARADGRKVAIMAESSSGRCAMRGAGTAGQTSKSNLQAPEKHQSSCENFSFGAWSLRILWNSEVGASSRSVCPRNTRNDGKEPDGQGPRNCVVSAGRRVFAGGSPPWRIFLPAGRAVLRVGKRACGLAGLPCMPGRLANAFAQSPAVRAGLKTNFPAPLLGGFNVETPIRCRHRYGTNSRCADEV